MLISMMEPAVALGKGCRFCYSHPPLVQISPRVRGVLGLSCTPLFQHDLGVCAPSECKELCSPCKLSLHLPYHQSTSLKLPRQEISKKVSLPFRKAPELTFTPALKSSVFLYSFIVAVHIKSSFEPMHTLVKCLK